MKGEGLEHFTITLDGREIRGRIYQRTPNDLSVRLLGECPLSTTAHIPTFAMEHMTFCDPLGDERARELLLELDSIAQIVSAKLDDWTEEWIALEKELETIEEQIRTIDERESLVRSELRRAFREGRIDQRTYQTSLRDQKKERDTLESELDDRRSSFLNERSPDLSEYEDQIIRKLRHNARERNGFAPNGLKLAPKERVSS